MKHMKFNALTMKFAWVVGAGLIGLTSQEISAQACNATGTCGGESAPAMTGNFVVPLANQEREPMLVGPQGPQGAQGAQGPQGAQGMQGPSALENSFYAYGSMVGAPNATAYASCGAARVVSGGGVCINYVDYFASMGHSNVAGHGWSGGCISSSGGLVGVQAFALCAPI